MMKLSTGLVFLLLLIFAISNCAQESTGLAPEATAAEVMAEANGAEDSFRNISILNEAFFNVAPTDRQDGVLVGELGVDGGDKAMILKLAQEIANNEHGTYDSFLIAHKGKLLFESYYNRGRINLPHPQASATKAYTGLALGRAIQLGYLTMADLDKPLVSFLKDLDPTKFVEGAELITLNKALINSSGIRISDEQNKEIEENPEALRGQGQVQVLLEQTTPITEASQIFKYGGGPRLVMQVIEAVVPGSAMDFIKTELLDKLGIINYGWKTAVTGLPEAGWRSSMSSRDMVKWGTLVTNKGKWNGEQLIQEIFINNAISRIILTDDDVDIYGGGNDVSKQGYGYFWWNADLKVGNKSYYCASVQGGGPQYIIIIEELDLMVVVTAHNNNDNDFLQIVAENIIPAFSREGKK